MTAFDEAAMALTSPLLDGMTGCDRLAMARRSLRDSTGPGPWRSLSDGERAYLLALHHLAQAAKFMAGFDEGLQARAREAWES